MVNSSWKDPKEAVEWTLKRTTQMAKEKWDAARDVVHIQVYVQVTTKKMAKKSNTK